LAKDAWEGVKAAYVARTSFFHL